MKRRLFTGIAICVLATLVLAGISSPVAAQSRWYALGRITGSFKGADAKIEWANPTVRDGGFSAETLWVANGAKWVEVGWTKENPPGSPPMGTYLYYAWNDGTYHQQFLESTGSHNTYKIEYYSSNNWRIYINGALRATVNAGFSTANRIDCGGEVTGNTNAMGVSGTLNLRYKTTDQRWLYWPNTTLYWDSPYWVVKLGGSNSNLQNGGNNP